MYFSPQHWNVFVVVEKREVNDNVSFRKEHGAKQFWK